MSSSSLRLSFDEETKITSNAYLANFKYNKNKTEEKWVALNKQYPRELISDCVINSIAFLQKLNRKEAEELSYFVNERRTGFSLDELHELLFEKDNIKYGFHYMYEKDSFPGYNYNIHTILSKLKSGYGTVLLMFKEERTSENYDDSSNISGHAVVLIKKNDYEAEIIDAQMEKNYEMKKYKQSINSLSQNENITPTVPMDIDSPDSELIHFLKMYDPSKICVISVNRKRLLASDKIKISKQKTLHKTKKRRINKMNVVNKNCKSKKNKSI